MRKLALTIKLDNVNTEGTCGLIFSKTIEFDLSHYPGCLDQIASGMKDVNAILFDVQQRLTTIASAAVGKDKPTLGRDT